MATNTLTAVQRAAVLLPVPRPYDVNNDQAEGSACVWCSSSLEGRRSVELGNRLKPGTLGRDTYWSPRACVGCARAKAKRVLAIHVSNCSGCRPGRPGCGTRYLLRGLASLRISGQAHQFLERDADGLGDPDQRVEERRGVALLDAAVRRYVDPGSLAHLALAEVVVQAYATDLLTHFTAAGDDPVVGRSGTRHPSTLSTS